MSHDLCVLVNPSLVNFVALVKIRYFLVMAAVRYHESNHLTSLMMSVRELAQLLLMTFLDKIGCCSVAM